MPVQDADPDLSALTTWLSLLAPFTPFRRPPTMLVISLFALPDTSINDPLALSAGVDVASLKSFNPMVP